MTTTRTIAKITGEQIRDLVIKVSLANKTGHVGSALSICEILASLTNHFKSGDGFVLSKGHAALAYYCYLYLVGAIDRESLYSYCKDGSSFGVHISEEHGNIGFSTGSLGMGLSYATGAALACKIQGTAGHTYCLISDAELDEGQTWEAAAFARAQNLDNLTCIVDDNGMQALGHSKNIIKKYTLERFNSFDWHTSSCDGHDEEVLDTCLSRGSILKPHVIVAHTIAGKGIPSIEDRVEAHYLPIKESQII